MYGLSVLLEIRLRNGLRSRKSERVDFDRGIPVYMMGIDGTWRRNCMMIDVSQTGARLLIEDSLEGLDLKEFFLPLVYGSGVSSLPISACCRGSNRRRVSGAIHLQKKNAAKNRSTDQTG